MSLRLMEHAQTLTGMEGYCFKAFAEAMEIIPYTLAENAGLNPIAVVTELRNRHVQGEKSAGINVRKVCSITAASLGHWSSLGYHHEYLGRECSPAATGLYISYQSS